MILTFPWHNNSKPDPTRKYIGLLGLVHLRSAYLLPTFIQFGIRIERQLRRTSGLIGYRTAADPVNLKFYHLSAWKDAGDIHNFVHAEPHLRAMRELAGRLGATTFRYWELEASELPLHPRRELQRLLVTTPVV